MIIVPAVDKLLVIHVESVLLVYNLKKYPYD